MNAWKEEIKMKKIILSIIAVFFCFGLFAKENIDDVLLKVCADISSRCEQQEIVAVLDFVAESKDMENYISSQLTSLILDKTMLQVVTRQHMDMVEKELKFQNSGLVSDNTALSVGERLGASKIIFGLFEELDNQYTLQVKMLDVLTGSYVLFRKYQVMRSSKTEQLLNRSAKIYKSSLGGIVEFNKNSISNIAPAFGISFEYSLLRRLSVGGKFIFSFDALEKENKNFTIEPLAFARWYIVSPTGEPSAGLFTEGQVGAELIVINSKLRAALSAGAVVGYRFVIKRFYVEPTLRVGYPYLFGIGCGCGVRF